MLSEEFWSKVVPTENCLLWSGRLNEDGYGRNTGRIEPDSQATRTRFAHRQAWEDVYGPVPEGMELDHLCRNRACVHANHMEPVPHQTNLDRGRHAGREMTHCKRGHPLDGDNAYFAPLTVSSDGYTVETRVCRTCRREYMREYRKTRAAATSN